MKDRLRISNEGQFNKKALLDKNGAPGTEEVLLAKGTKVLSMKKISGIYLKCKYSEKIVWVSTSDLTPDKKDK